MAAPPLLELRPDKFDGVQVAAASGSIEHLHPAPLEHSLDVGVMVAAQVVHDQQGVVGPDDAGDELVPEEVEDVVGGGALGGVPDQLVLGRAEGSEDGDPPSVCAELAFYWCFGPLPYPALLVPDAGAGLVEVDDIVALVDVAD